MTLSLQGFILNSSDLDFLHAFKFVICSAEAESEPQVTQLLTRLIIYGKINMACKNRRIKRETLIHSQFDDLAPMLHLHIHLLILIHSSLREVFQFSHTKK